MLLQVKLLWAFLLGEDAGTKYQKTVRKGTGAFIISSCCSVSHKSSSTPTGGTRMWAGGGWHSGSRDMALPPCLTRPHLQRRPTGKACGRGPCQGTGAEKLWVRQRHDPSTSLGWTSVFVGCCDRKSCPGDALRYLQGFASPATLSAAGLAQL